MSENKQDEATWKLELLPIGNRTDVPGYLRPVP